MQGAMNFPITFGRTIAMREWTYWIGSNSNYYSAMALEQTWWSIFPEFRQFVETTDEAYLKREYASKSMIVASAAPLVSLWY